MAWNISTSRQFSPDLEILVHQVNVDVAPSIVLDAGGFTPDANGDLTILAGTPLKKVGNQYVPWVTGDSAPILGILARTERVPDALTHSDVPSAMHDRAVNRIFGTILSIEDQEILPSRVIEFAGRTLALYLLDPGIEYWSRQVISRTVGEREAAAYKDRAEDLRQLKKEWTAQLADLFIDVQDLLPVLPGRAADIPRVALPGQLVNSVDNPRTQGDQVVHATANPYDLEPMYGPPEETA